MSESKKRTRVPVPGITVLRANSLRTWSPFLPSFDESLTYSVPGLLDEATLAFDHAVQRGHHTSFLVWLVWKQHGGLVAEDLRVPGRGGGSFRASAASIACARATMMDASLVTCKHVRGHKGLGTGHKFDGLKQTHTSQLGSRPNHKKQITSVCRPLCSWPASSAAWTLADWASSRSLAARSVQRPRP